MISNSMYGSDIDQQQQISRQVEFGVARWYIWTSRHTPTHPHTPTHTNTYTRLHTHTPTHAYTRIHLHTYTPTHLHTHTRLLILKSISHQIYIWT